MANSRQIVALNVGSQRVSMGVFSKTSKDALILDRYATRLVVLDPSAEGLRLTKIGEAIAGLVQELNVKGSVVNYSVSGQSVFIRFVKLPALDDTDVEQLIRFEAQQHVPFPLDEVVWDYHLLPAKGLEREAILVAIKAEDLMKSSPTAFPPAKWTARLPLCTMRMWTVIRMRKNRSCSSTSAPNPRI